MLDIPSLAPFSVSEEIHFYIIIIIIEVLEFLGTFIPRYNMFLEVIVRGTMSGLFFRVFAVDVKTGYQPLQVDFVFCYIADIDCYFYRFYLVDFGILGSHMYNFILSVSRDSLIFFLLFNPSPFFLLQLVL